jgi:hypothetical protein
MKKLINHLLLVSLIISTACPVISQEKMSSKPLAEGLFQLNEIDMHVHAGKERPLPLNEWIDLSVRNGRKVMLLLDHLELYRLTDSENKAWIKKNNFSDWYPNPATGKYDLMKDLSSIEIRKDVITFRGWEIWEGELNLELEKQPMKEAEVIGWHLSKTAWKGKAPAGKEFIIRARQILEISCSHDYLSSFYGPF